MITEVKPDGHMYELLDHEGKPNGVYIAVLGDDSKDLCEKAQISGETSGIILPIYLKGN